jgi:hypothetical protein
MCVALSGSRLLSEYLAAAVAASTVAGRPLHPASIGTFDVQHAVDDATSSSGLIEAPRIRSAYRRIRFLPLKDPRPPLRPGCYAARAAYPSRQPLCHARPPAIAWTSTSEASSCPASDPSRAARAAPTGNFRHPRADDALAPDVEDRAPLDCGHKRAHGAPACQQGHGRRGSRTTARTTQG